MWITRTLLKKVCWAVLSVCVVSCNVPTKKEQSHESITVFVASSLGEVIGEIRDSFQVQYGVRVHLNVASSGTLARQIEQGLVPDVFISANRRWVAYLDDLGLVAGHKSMDVAYTDLVLVVPRYSMLNCLIIDSTRAIIDRLGDGRFSIGNPAHVPAGQYAEESLVYYDIYDGLQDQLLLARNVRAALMNVELGEAEMGLVYRTDALKSSKVKIIGQVPEQSHQAICYVASVLNSYEMTSKFYGFLKEATSGVIWRKHGFR